MNKEEQYLLFALSAPMEILNQGCKPAHDSPKMYTGIKEFELSSSWGINNRDDLIQTIYQMTDDGHANDLAGLYLTWHRSSPEEWKALRQAYEEALRLAVNPVEEADDEEKDAAAEHEILRAFRTLLDSESDRFQPSAWQKFIQQLNTWNMEDVDQLRWPL
ncbi:TPA: DUF1266 domain-containing protein, partial [Escherichia coli]